MRPIDADAFIAELREALDEEVKRIQPRISANWMRGVYNTIEVLFKTLDKTPPVGWISVKERLPKDEKWVAALLYGLVGYNTILLQYNAMLNEFITDDGIEYDIDDVAYWVGLPEPPEVEG